MKAKGGLTSDEMGCFIIVMAVAAVFLGSGWLLGEILLAPPHCGSSGCGTWPQELRLLTISSFVGLGCLGLAAANILQKPMFVLGAGILAITTFAGHGNPVTFIRVGVDFILTMGVLGWLLVLWREG